MATDLEELYTAAEQAIRAKDWTTATQHFEQIRDKTPDQVDVLNNLALCYQHTNKENVSQIYEQALKIDAKDETTLKNAAGFYYRRREFSQALKHYEELSQLSSRNITIQFNIGVCNDELKKYEESIIAYRRVLDREPKHQKALTNLAIALDKQNKGNEAKQYFEEAIKLGASAKIHNNYGLCLKRNGQAEEAILQYKKAWFMEPDYSLAHYNLANQLVKLKKYDEAIETYSKAKENNKLTTNINIALAKCFSRKGEPQQALQIYKEVHAERPDIRGVDEKIRKLKTITESEKSRDFEEASITPVSLLTDESHTDSPKVALALAAIIDDQDHRSLASPSGTAQQSADELKEQSLEVPDIPAIHVTQESEKDPSESQREQEKHRMAPNNSTESVVAVELEEEQLAVATNNQLPQQRAKPDNSQLLNPESADHTLEGDKPPSLQATLSVDDPSEEEYPTYRSQVSMNKRRSTARRPQVLTPHLNSDSSSEDENAPVVPFGGNQLQDIESDSSNSSAEDELAIAPMPVPIEGDQIDSKAESPKQEEVVEEPLDPDFEKWTLNQWLQLRKKDPNHIHAAYRAGQLYMEQCDYKNAVYLLNVANESEEPVNFVQTAHWIGECYYELKKYAKSKKFYNRLLKLSPYDTDLYLKISKCEEKLGNYAEAKTPLHKLLDLDPKLAYGYARLGWIKILQKKIESGLRNLEKAAAMTENDARILGKYGEALMIQGKDYVKANEVLQRSHAVDSSLNSTIAALGYCAQKLNKVDEAIQYYELAVSQSTKRHSVYYHLGWIYEEKENFTRAIELFKQCLQYNKENFGAAVRTADLLLKRLNLPEKASKYYYHALKLDDNDIRVHYGVAKSLVLSKKNIDRAADHYKFVIKRDTKHHLALCELGLIYFEKKEFEKSAELIKESIKVNPKFTFGFVTMGNLLYEYGRHKNAAKYYKQALKISPNEAQALIGLGNCLYELGKVTDAVKNYQMALRQNKNTGCIYYNLGNAFLKLENLEGSIEYFQNAIQLDENHAESYYNLGNVYCLKHDFTTAITNYQKCLQKDPKNAAAYFNLGNAFYLQEKYKDAISAFNKSLIHDNRSAECYFNLASLYNDMGDPDKAIYNFEESLKIDDTNAETFYNLGLLFEKKRNADKAINFYETALQLNPELTVVEDRLNDLK